VNIEALMFSCHVCHSRESRQKLTAEFFHIDGGNAERKQPRKFLRGFALRLDESCRATLRADIWIPRPVGSVCREKEIDKA
jgi:hypothetical protein